MQKRFFIQTFGCQMNERDSETLSGMLSQLGYIEVNKKDDANIVVINTCSVRENADKRFYGTLGQLKKLKEKDPTFIACICGCMMQQESIVNDVKDKYPWVDIIFGTHNIHNFPNLLEAIISEGKLRKINKKGGIVEVLEDGKIIEGLPAKRRYDHKAFVTIMNGCNNFCTYCIVPYTRGREKSRSPEYIIGEIKDLVLNGCKEVTLLGQNVNSYRFGEIDFPKLILKIEEETSLERLRFMTSHPKDLSDELIKVYGKSNILCDSIHLPVQSGSNEVLEKMNRKYTKEDYINLVSKIRRARPNIGITTDIIVGFPSESEENFLDTISLVKEIGFDSAFTFIYSPRKGTPAYSYDNQIDDNLKHERFNRLVSVVNKIANEKNKGRVGQVERVLIESLSKKNKEVLTGRTSQFKTVNMPLPKNVRKEDLIGSVRDVLINEGNTFTLTGEIVL